MRKINLIATCLLSFCSGKLQASSITLNLINAQGLNNFQWQAVNNLWNASFYNAYRGLPFDQIDDDIQGTSKEALADYLQRRFDKYRLTAIKEGYSLVLAYKEEKLVGYTLYHLLPWSESEQQTIMHIDHFAVDPNYQGQGIGKKLLEATITLTTSKPDVASIVLTTRILNKQAQGFYKTQGFYEIKAMDGVPFDSRYSILLRKDLR